MAAREYKTVPVHRVMGVRSVVVATEVIRIGSKGGRTLVASYTNPHSANALVRLLNNQKDQEA